MSRGGFISSTIAPVQRKREKMGLIDGAILFALALGMTALVVICTL